MGAGLVDKVAVGALEAGEVPENLRGQCRRDANAEKGARDACWRRRHSEGGRRRSASHRRPEEGRRGSNTRDWKAEMEGGRRKERGGEEVECKERRADLLGDVLEALPDAAAGLVGGDLLDLGDTTRGLGAKEEKMRSGPRPKTSRNRNLTMYRFIRENEKTKKETGRARARRAGETVESSDVKSRPKGVIKTQIAKFYIYWERKRRSGPGAAERREQREQRPHGRQAKRESAFCE